LAPSTYRSLTVSGSASSRNPNRLSVFRTSLARTASGIAIVARRTTMTTFTTRTRSMRTPTGPRKPSRDDKRASGSVEIPRTSRRTTKM
jgi:hypothetical protein